MIALDAALRRLTVCQLTGECPLSLAPLASFDPWQGRSTAGRFHQRSLERYHVKATRAPSASGPLCPGRSNIELYRCGNGIIAPNAVDLSDPPKDSFLRRIPAELGRWGDRTSALSSAMEQKRCSPG